MTYSDSLARRTRYALGRRRGLSEKKLFGGLGFLLNGNLLVCVWGDSLIVRLGAEAAPAALEEEFVRPFDVTGKPMSGWVVVEPDGIDTDRQLAEWIERAIVFVSVLPPK